MDRREFIKGTTVFAGTVLGGLPACGVRSEVSVLANSDAIDEGLQMISRLAPLGNHAPMAIESLVTLGRPDRVVSFVEKYSRRFAVRHPVSIARIDTSNWKEALGRSERNLDWTNFFHGELKEIGWKAAVAKWTEVLVPGLAAAAGHGVIRTCHAVRSISRRETGPRTNELAEALGYWAAFYQPLPETHLASSTKWPITEAVKKVPVLPDEKRRRGSIMEQLRSLNDFTEFGGVIDQVKIAGPSDTVVSRLTETFARIYIERATDRNDLNLLHAVTVTSGIRSLLPYLKPDTTTRLLRYGWQTAAAMIAISGNETPQRTATVHESKDDLVERAITSNEEHSIKFTEACIRESQLNPDPIFLRAASAAVSRLPRH